MTPLAHRIVKELALPVAERTFCDQTLAKRLGDVHCFEVSQVSEMAMDLGDKMLAKGVPEAVCSFLPFPSTWIETREFPFARGERIALWLQELPHGHCSLTVVRDCFVGSPATFNLAAIEGVTAQELAAGTCYAGTPAYRQTAWIWAVLAIINTPRLIGRKQHMPHRGLQRRLVQAKALIGKFPLHAWTEITLSISTMMKAADGSVRETRLTGEKCLHDVRAHYHVRQGRVVIIRAHQRGNPALGIKRSRYKLAA